MKSAHASKPPMHASSQSLKDSKTSEPSRCSSIAVTSLSGLSGNSMLQLRRHQELSPNQALHLTPYSLAPASLRLPAAGGAALDTMRREPLKV